MNKLEFEQKVDQRISEDTYDLIELVYTYHPCIHKSIDKIAYLWDNFGLRIILDMLPTARRVKYIDNEMDKLQSDYSKLKEELFKIKNLEE